jgi:hypothetical protein
VVDAAVESSEPLVTRSVQGSPGAARDVVDHAFPTSTVENGTGPLVEVIVPVEDDVHAIRLEEGHQVGLNATRAAVLAGAVGGIMKEDELPGAVGLQVAHQPLILGASRLVALVGVQGHKVGVPPVERIVRLFSEHVGITLVATAIAIQFVIADAGIERRALDALAVNVEIGSDVLVSGAVITRAYTTAVDDVAGMQGQVEAVLGHLGSHVPSCPAGRGAAVTGPAVAQDDEAKQVGLRLGGEGDLRPGRQVVTGGVYLVGVGGVRRQTGDRGRVPVLAVVDVCRGGYDAACAVMDFAGPRAVGDPGDGHRVGGGVAQIGVDQQARWQAGRRGYIGRSTGRR